MGRDGEVAPVIAIQVAKGMHPMWPASRHPSRPDAEGFAPTLFLTLAAVLFVVLQLAIAPQSLAGLAPQKGHSKVLISHLGAAQFVDEDFTVLEDYDSYTLGTIAEENIEKVKNRAAAKGFSVSVHDEYDRLGLPGGTIDTRIGLITPLGGERAEEYPAGKHGLYILQLIGPTKTAWISEIRGAGAVIVGAVALNGYFVAMTPQVAETVRAMRPVQFLDRYHSFLKAAMVDRQTRQMQYVCVQIAEAPDTAETVAEVTEILGIATQRKDHGGFYLCGFLRASDLSRVLANRLVVGVHAITPLGPSDEAAAIPTLSEWFLIALMLSLSAVAIIRLKA